MNAKDFIMGQPTYVVARVVWSKQVSDLVNSETWLAGTRWLNSAGSPSGTPVRLTLDMATQARVAFLKDYGQLADDVIIEPVDDQSQMYWQGRRWPEDFNESQLEEALEDDDDPKTFIMCQRVPLVARVRFNSVPGQKGEWRYLDMDGDVYPKPKNVFKFDSIRDASAALERNLRELNLRPDNIEFVPITLMGALVKEAFDPKDFIMGQPERRYLVTGLRLDDNTVFYKGDAGEMTEEIEGAVRYRRVDAERVYDQLTTDFGPWCGWQFDIIDAPIEEAEKQTLVASVAIICNEKVCLVKGDKWALPGGKAKEAESVFHTAARETEEECGIKIKPADLIFVGIVKRSAHRTDSIFVYELEKEQQVKPGSDAKEAVWCALDSLPELGKGHQQAIKKALRVLKMKPEERGQLIVFEGVDGSGKCFGKNTSILMYDGTVKMVQDIKEGEFVMGPDSKSRRVFNLARGREKLYRVVPKKGESYVVNESHVLALRVAGKSRKYGTYQDKNGCINIGVKEWLTMSSAFKRNAPGYRAAVEFGPYPVLISPYILGLWLGDGTTGQAALTTADIETLIVWQKEATERGLFVSSQGKYTHRMTSESAVESKTRDSRRDSNSFTADLRKYGIFDKKRVPYAYRCNSTQVRLEVLAGLMDSDGHLCRGGFDFVNKNKGLAEDVCYLARSVGLAAYMKKCVKSCQTGAAGYYWRVSISGYCNRIPTLIQRKQALPRRINKNVLNVGIDLEPLTVGDYYGFQVSGDGLFMLGDFTVVHNSTQTDMTVKWLKKHGFPVIETKWNSSPIISPSIKKAKKTRELSPMLYHLLHSADMLHRYEQTVLPALGRNFVVVCDRYWPTGIVRDRLRGVKEKAAYAKLRKPDVLFYLSAKPEAAVKRLMKAGRLSWYGLGMDLNYADDEQENAIEYSRRMKRMYARALPAGHVAINAGRRVGKIFNDVKAKLERRLHAHYFHGQNLNERAEGLVSRLLEDEVKNFIMANGPRSFIVVGTWDNRVNPFGFVGTVIDSVYLYINADGSIEWITDGDKATRLTFKEAQSEVKAAGNNSWVKNVRPQPVYESSDSKDFIMVNGPRKWRITGTAPDGALLYLKQKPPFEHSWEVDVAQATLFGPESMGRLLKLYQGMNKHYWVQQVKAEPVLEESGVARDFIMQQRAIIYNIVGTLNSNGIKVWYTHNGDWTGAASLRNLVWRSKWRGGAEKADHWVKLLQGEQDPDNPGVVNIRMEVE